MRRTIGLAAALALSAGTAQGIIVIDGGTHVIPQAAGQQIPIFISSAPAIGIDAAVVAGEIVGGPDGMTHLPVTDLILAGPPTIWPPPGPGIPPVLLPTGFFDGSAGGAASANGILAVVVVDATGAPPGDYAVILDGTSVFGPGGTEAEIPSQKINGVITVTPEPATGLLLLALTPLVPRRRRASIETTAGSGG